MLMNRSCGCEMLWQGAADHTFCKRPSLPLRNDPWHWHRKQPLKSRRVGPGARVGTTECRFRLTDAALSGQNAEQWQQSRCSKIPSRAELLSEVPTDAPVPFCRQLRRPHQLYRRPRSRDKAEKHCKRSSLTCSANIIVQRSTSIRLRQSSRSAVRNLTAIQFLRPALSPPRAQSFLSSVCNSGQPRSAESSRR